MGRVNFILPFHDRLQALHDSPKCSLRMPQVGVTQAGVEELFRPKRFKVQAVALCQFCEMSIRCESNFVAPATQFKREPQQGEDVAGAAEGRANEMHGGSPVCL